MTSGQMYGWNAVTKPPEWFSEQIRKNAGTISACSGLLHASVTLVTDSFIDAVPTAWPPLKSTFSPGAESLFFMFGCSTSDSSRATLVKNCDRFNYRFHRRGLVPIFIVPSPSSAKKGAFVPSFRWFVSCNRMRTATTHLLLSMNFLIFISDFLVNWSPFAPPPFTGPLHPWQCS